MVIHVPFCFEPQPLSLSSAPASFVMNFCATPGYLSSITKPYFIEAPVSPSLGDLLPRWLLAHSAAWATLAQGSAGRGFGFGVYL